MEIGQTLPLRSVPASQVNECAVSEDHWQSLSELCRSPGYNLSPKPPALTRMWVQVHKYSSLQVVCFRICATAIQVVVLMEYLRLTTTEAYQSSTPASVDSI
jgi:hypothetical protein